MAIMDPGEAQHFCSGYLRSRTAQESFRNWAKAQPNATRFSEGSARFESFKDLSIGEVERSLLLSASHYRRAHDSFCEIGSAWAYVTLYYGSFFAARALMGLFGVWLVNNKRVLTATRTTPGSQQFDVRSYTSPTGAGSHAQFWELYYNEMITLSPHLSPADRLAVTSPTAGFDWQSVERNRLNYDSFDALELGVEFDATFTTSGFPGSLPGTLNTQYQFLEVALRVLTHYAGTFGINTDAIDALSALPERRARFRNLIVSKSPRALGNRAKSKLVYG